MQLRQRKASTLHSENESLNSTSRESTAQKWLGKLETLAWVALAVGIAYFTNLKETIAGLDHG